MSLILYRFGIVILLILIAILCAYTQYKVDKLLFYIEMIIKIEYGGRHEQNKSNAIR